MEDISLLADKVDSKTELALFLERLSEDFEKDRESWDNRDIPTYLRALSNWLRSSDGYFKNIQQEPLKGPTWQLIAIAHLAASNYE